MYIHIYIYIYTYIHINSFIQDSIGPRSRTSPLQTQVLIQPEEVTVPFDLSAPPTPSPHTPPREPLRTHTAMAGVFGERGTDAACHIHTAAVRCDMVFHQAFCARRVRNNGIGGKVRHGVTSGASCETCLNQHVTPHLHREYHIACPACLCPPRPTATDLRPVHLLRVSISKDLT